MELYFRNFSLILLLSALFVSAQDYADYADSGNANDYYAQDSIYYDYANKQVGRQGFRGGDLVRFLGTLGAGYFACSKFGCGREVKRLKKKHLREQKDLYSQYYNDIHKLQEHQNELYSYIEKLEKTLKKMVEEREEEELQRDLDEFSQPDTDKDGLISRAEFNHYVKTYLANFPGLSPEDYPKWEDFDHNKDGYMTFQEYRQQMALQVQRAKQKENKEAEKGLQGLYKETNKAGNFNDLYAQLRKSA
jgi:Ca2+-binding EF-hand superfamily protein